MSPRFITNLLVLLVGALVVVASQAFTAGVTGWIAFGIALGILGTVGIAQLDRTRGMVQHALDALGGVLGVWMVIASVVFNGTTLTWLSFAEALGFVGLAVVGLVAHERSSERVVHSLAIDDTQRATDGARTTSHYSAAA